LRHPRPNDFVFDVAVLNLVCFGHLTRRANQAHIAIIAGIAEARAGNGGGLFRFEIVGQVGFNLSKPFRRIFRNLLRGGCSQGRKPAKPVACSATLYCDGQLAAGALAIAARHSAEYAHQDARSE
jgi:hypothetical protein